eukprot:5850097-Prymnesium_polylepis.2
MRASRPACLCPPDIAPLPAHGTCTPCLPLCLPKGPRYCATLLRRDPGRRGADDGAGDRDALLRARAALDRKLARCARGAEWGGQLGGAGA